MQISVRSAFLSFSAYHIEVKDFLSDNKMGGISIVGGKFDHFPRPSSYSDEISYLSSEKDLITLPNYRVSRLFSPTDSVADSASA